MVLLGEPLVLSRTPMLLIGRTNKIHEVVPSNCKGGWVISTPVWLLEPTCVTRAYMINSSLHVGWVNWSEQMNINRGVALLIWNTHSHLCSALVEKRSRWRRTIRLWSPCWFYLLSFWDIYIEECFVWFFPLGFSQDKSFCSFCMVVLVYLSVILFICFCYEKWNEILMSYLILWKFNNA